MYGFEVSVIRMVIKEKDKIMKNKTTTMIVNSSVETPAGKPVEIHVEKPSDLRVVKMKQEIELCNFR